LRDAISLLDQLASNNQEILSSLPMNLLHCYNQAVFVLINMLLAGDTAAGLDCIHRSWNEGSDPRSLPTGGRLLA
jgi:DNA polymerase III gamma/tau subunit